MQHSPKITSRGRWGAIAAAGALGTLLAGCVSLVLRALSPIRCRRRTKRLPRAVDAIRRERGKIDPERRDTRRAHTALLAMLVALAIATVVYAIVRESAAALIFLALIAVQIRLAAIDALRPPERADSRDIAFIP